MGGIFHFDDLFFGVGGMGKGGGEGEKEGEEKMGTYWLHEGLVVGLFD